VTLRTFIAPTPATLLIAHRPVTRGCTKSISTAALPDCYKLAWLLLQRIWPAAPSCRRWLFPICSAVSQDVTQTWWPARCRPGEIIALLLVEHSSSLLILGQQPRHFAVGLFRPDSGGLPTRFVKMQTSSKRRSPTSLAIP